jgi:hypothetical protein
VTLHLVVSRRGRTLKDLTHGVKEKGKFNSTEVTRTLANNIQGELSKEITGRKRKGAIGTFPIA